MQNPINKFKENKRFDSIESNLDFLIKKAIEHSERLKRIEENMATKSDIRQITNTLDKVVGMLEKRDQEVTLLSHDFKNLEDKVESHDRDIQKMKPLLGVS